jgi:hypothetical protein
MDMTGGLVALSKLGSLGPIDKIFSTFPLDIPRCYLIKSVLVLIIVCRSLPACAMDLVTLGPLDAVLSINNVEIKIPITSEISIDSQGGVMNANGAVMVSAEVGNLGPSLEAIAKTMLPHKFHTAQCDIIVRSLYQVKVISIAHEVRISGSSHIEPENCRAPEMDVSLELVFIPVWIDKSTIRFKLPRDPKVIIPLLLRIPAQIFVGDLRKIARKSIQKFLDSSDNAKLSIPNLERISTQRITLLFFELSGMHTSHPGHCRI